MKHLYMVLGILVLRNIRIIVLQNAYFQGALKRGTEVPCFVFVAKRVVKCLLILFLFFFQKTNISDNDHGLSGRN